MKAFSHTPIDLDRPAIRLLRLLRGSEPEIECEIFQAWLDDDKEDTIPYEALSYTWGGTDRSASVQVNGLTHNVTENLYLALQHLRWVDEDRVIWVDAICIDQTNLRERGHQVGQMGSIYSGADRVLIWLGPGTDDTDVILDSLKRLEKISTKDWNFADHRWSEAWAVLQPDLRSRYWDLANRQRRGLEFLLARPWFRRVWILQEVANARKAMVCSGTKSVSARVFATAPMLIAVQPEDHCQAVLDIMPGRSRETSWWKDKRNLFTLVLKFGGSESGDPRDKIFALLGICSDNDGDGALHADYTKDLQDVVHATAAFLFDLHEYPEDYTLLVLMQHVGLWNAIYLEDVAGHASRHRVPEFIEQGGKASKVTNDVHRMAAANRLSGQEVMACLAEQMGHNFRITTTTLEAAAKNHRSGAGIIKLLYEQLGEEVVIVAAKCEASVFGTIMEQTGTETRITRQVIEEVIRNSQHGWGVVLEIIKHQGSTQKAIDQVIEVDTGDKHVSISVLELLLENRDDVFASPEQEEDMLNMLHGQLESEIDISSSLVEAAAKNATSGWKVLAFLLSQDISKIRLKHSAISAARSILVAMAKGVRYRAHKVTADGEIIWDDAQSLFGYDSFQDIALYESLDYYKGAYTEFDKSWDPWFGGSTRRYTGDAMSTQFITPILKYLSHRHVFQDIYNGWKQVCALLKDAVETKGHRHRIY